MIEASNLNISFGKKAVASNFSLKAGAGKRVAVIGGNGSGKTTIALFFAGVIPDFIKACVTGNFSCKGKIGLVMQNPSSQFLSLAVRDELPDSPKAWLNLSGLLDRNVFELSEGEKQKVNLAASILRKCSVLLLDEPLELLDPIEAKNFMKLINALKATTIIWFDKSDSFLGKGWRKVFLGSRQKAKMPVPVSHCRSTVVLNADFSVKNNGFFLGRAKIALHDGEKIALIGLNGSGKTTLLKTIAGAIKKKGTITASKQFSFAPQNPTSFFFGETVEADLPGSRNAELLGIRHLLGSNPAKLSKGQQKMASIAAIAPNSIALLDEPTTWLDEKNKANVCRFIANSSQPMIIATHDRRMLRYCDKIFMVKEGRLLPCSNTTANRFFQNGLNS